MPVATVCVRYKLIPLNVLLIYEMVAENDGVLIDSSKTAGGQIATEVIEISPLVFVTLVFFASKEYESILVNVKKETSLTF